MDDAQAFERRVIPDEPSKTNGELFEELFRAKGAHTGMDRARLLGMPRRSVYRYAKGEVEPGLATARWIASRLGAKVDELWPAA